jgi:hypothetical protein
LLFEGDPALSDAVRELEVVKRGISLDRPRLFPRAPGQQPVQGRIKTLRIDQTARDDERHGQHRRQAKRSRCWSDWKVD